MRPYARCCSVSFTRESKILSVICLVDLAVTLALLSTSSVQEGNPLMNFYLQWGVGAFIIVKLCLLILPIFVAEWCGQYRPKFVRKMLRFAIAAYVGTYALLFVQHNVPVLLADGLHASGGDSSQITQGLEVTK